MKTITVEYAYDFLGTAYWNVTPSREFRSVTLSHNSIWGLLSSKDKHDFFFDGEEEYKFTIENYAHQELMKVIKQTYGE